MVFLKVPLVPSLPHHLGNEAKGEGTKANKKSSFLVPFWSYFPVSVLVLDFLIYHHISY